MHNLLDDALIEVRLNSGAACVDLPGLIAGLLDGSVAGCTGLRAHQADLWHVFLVQLAASVMARHPELGEPPCDRAFWLDGLLSLSDGKRSAWELYVEDVTRPAFLQHPLPEMKALEEFKPKTPKAQTPDELDVLVTAKDHDVKAARMRNCDPQAWLFALVSYQTSSGYLGSGNHGTIRMNGGFASRSVVSLISDLRPSVRFAEELKVVRTMRADALACGLGYLDRGAVLTWLSPWDRKASQFPVNRLEPWFVEAVRPVRLVRRDDGFVALGASAEARQIGPKTLDNGDVADPWTPINVADRKKGRSALTVGESGWSAELISRLLFQRDIEVTALQRPRLGMTGQAWLVGSVLVRGQGTTEGFHRFAVPVPASIRLRLLGPDEREQLGKASTAFITDAKAAEGALRGALAIYAEGGPDQANFGNDTLMRWVKSAEHALSLQWQDAFFPVLWGLAEAPLDDVQAAWRAKLVELTRSAFESSLGALPVPGARRMRAIVHAQRFLEGSFHKKGLLPPRQSESREAA